LIIWNPAAQPPPSAVSAVVLPPNSRAAAGYAVISSAQREAHLVLSAPILAGAEYIVDPLDRQRSIRAGVRQRDGTPPGRTDAGDLSVPERRDHRCPLLFAHVRSLRGCV